ncbi:serine/threonine-protein kinase [Frankia sp. AgPm24]|uniref:serine/threonine-protein kinase n=1 Tax=Frankia sp. AgPm24 TaxID=631128 RepID=UPI00200D83CB|nr:serine/threonine-protein kinase [Frankia sp. AgPm24]MCK9923632.1 serine/threonine-protein kinase [Frankia sp. AgPm24]
MILPEYVRSALPDYDVGRELGRGGFGRVFAARHRRLDRAVAVKVLPLAADDDAVEAEPTDTPSGTGTVGVLFGGRRSAGTAVLAAGRVDAEAHIVASLDHPHIVRVFDFVRTPETALIVMELLPGGTLDERVRDGLSAPGGCAVAAAIAVALDRVHREGLLHCDIKPSNIMFTADGAPRLTDFGIARLLETTVGIAQTSVVGSTPYLAPEQFELAVPGTGVDVYSLGAVLYELLAGTPPFGADPRPHVMAERHRSALPPPLPARFGALDAVTRRALAKDPADRQPGALAFATDLCDAADLTFGPDWLTHTGIRFRGDDDLRRPARTHGPAQPAPPAQPRPAGPPGPPGPASMSARMPGQVGPARRGGPSPSLGPSARFGPWSTARFGRWWTAPVGVSVATTVAVVAIVVALLATGILSVGRPNTAASGEGAGATSTAAAPIVYPVSAPLPLRGLISLAADPAGGILLTDSSQHTLTRFVDGKVTSIVGRPANVATTSTDPGPDGTSTPTGTGSTGGLERPERIGLPGVARDEPAADAGLHRPAGLSAGGGSVFVADEWNCVVRRLYQPLGQPWRAETIAGRPAAEPTGTTIAGAGAGGGDPNAGRAPEQICPAGGASSTPRALGTRVGTPTSVAVGGDGAVYFTTGYAGQVWRLDPAGASGDYRSTPATLVAGTGTGTSGGGGGGGGQDRRGAGERRYDGAESATAVGLDNAYAVAVDGVGRVFVLSYAAGYARIHLIENARITTVVQRRLDESALTTLAPAPGGRGVLFTDADARTITLLDPPTAAGPGATRVVVRGTCVGATERLFGVAVDRAGDLYYSCNDASQAGVYRLTAGDLAAGVAGPGRRVLY